MQSGSHPWLDWVPKQEGPDVPARGLSFRREGSPYPSGIYGPGPGNTTSSLRARIYQTGAGESRPVGLTKRWHCGGGWLGNGTGTQARPLLSPSSKGGGLGSGTGTQARPSPSLVL